MFFFYCNAWTYLLVTSKMRKRKHVLLLVKKILELNRPLNKYVLNVVKKTKTRSVTGNLFLGAFWASPRPVEAQGRPITDFAYRPTNNLYLLSVPVPSCFFFFFYNSSKLLSSVLPIEAPCPCVAVCLCQSNISLLIAAFDLSLSLSTACFVLFCACVLQPFSVNYLLGAICSGTSQSPRANDKVH